MVQEYQTKCIMSIFDTNLIEKDLDNVRILKIVDDCINRLIRDDWESKQLRREFLDEIYVYDFNVHTVYEILEIIIRSCVVITIYNKIKKENIHYGSSYTILDKNTNCLEIKFSKVHHDPRDDNGILCIYNRKLSDEELRKIKRYSLQ